MNLIFITRSRRTFNIRFGPALCVLTVCLSVLTAATFFWLGNRYASIHVADTMTESYARAGDIWSREILEQKKMIKDARDVAQKHLDSMAARLSTLQGHVMRLNALGSRLARMAELDDEIDFSLDERPGMGGPQPASRQSALTVPDFLTAMEQLYLEIEDRNDKLIAMESMLIDRNLQSETVPTGRPIDDGWISSLFGWRTDPITGRKELHEGIDFAAKYGSQIKSVAAGIVTWSGRRAGYGNMIEIDHGNGYITRYAHNKENLVTVGQKVRKGTVVATLGSTGRSTGSHVHFEVQKDGKYVNPKKFIAVNQ